MAFLKLSLNISLISNIECIILFLQYVYKILPTVFHYIPKILSFFFILFILIIVLSLIFFFHFHLLIYDAHWHQRTLFFLIKVTHFTNLYLLNTKMRKHFLVNCSVYIQMRWNFRSKMLIHWN